PKVYAVFTVPKQPHGIHYLVSEFIEGEMLDETKWIALDDKAREIICSKLSEQFQLLWAVPSEGCYGRVHHQAFSSDFNLFYLRPKGMQGPYNCYEDCVSAMYASAELRAATTAITPEFRHDAVEYLPEFKPTLMRTRGYKPTLTHLDPQFRNIITRSIKGAEGEIKDWEVVLIDWDSLAWLPGFVHGSWRRKGKGSVRKA
ncbi:uncharacterized protein BDZ99DRAFT_374125, partial [Mytilinidion resinicola]